MPLNIIFESAGESFVFNAGFDLSSSAPLVLNFRPERGEVKTVPATLGLVPLDGFEANQYVTYTTTTEVLDQIGRWQAQLGYGTLKTHWIHFNVT